MRGSVLHTLRLLAKTRVVDLAHAITGVRAGKPVSKAYISQVLNGERELRRDLDERVCQWHQAAPWVALRTDAEPVGEPVADWRWALAIWRPEPPLGHIDLVNGFGTTKKIGLYPATGHWLDLALGVATAITPGFAGAEVVPITPAYAMKLAAADGTTTIEIDGIAGYFEHIRGIGRLAVRGVQQPWLPSSPDG